MPNSNDFEEWRNQASRYCAKVSAEIDVYIAINQVSTNFNSSTQTPSEQYEARKAVIDTFSDTISKNMDIYKNSDLSEARKSDLQFKTLECIDIKRRLQATQDSKEYNSFLTRSYMWESKHPNCHNLFMCMECDKLLIRVLGYGSSNKINLSTKIPLELNE